MNKIVLFLLLLTLLSCKKDNAYVIQQHKKNSFALNEITSRSEKGNILPMKSNILPLNTDAKDLYIEEVISDNPVNIDDYIGGLTRVVSDKVDRTKGFHINAYSRRISDD